MSQGDEQVPTMHPMPGSSHDDRDAEVRSVLIEKGDDGRVQRHTLFFLYGPGDHEGLRRAARLAGFKATGIAGSGTVLETSMSVDVESFGPVRRQMETWAEAYGLEYDGWECRLIVQ